MKYIIDIQDLWPEAFCMVLPYNWMRLLMKPIEWYANRIYQAADAIVAVSETYVHRGISVNQKVDKGLCFYLGNDGHLFDESKIKFATRRAEGELWIAYVGTLGHSYDLDCAIDAIAIAQRQLGDGARLKFVIIGDGPLMERFKAHAQEQNVYCDFVGRLAYPEMVGLMCSCDMVINPIMHDAAQSITNKVGDYALSGLPVINTQECPEYRELVETYQCGINCRCGDAEDVAKAIRRLAMDRLLRERMGMNARRLGVERFDRRITYGHLADMVETQAGKDGEIMIISNFVDTIDYEAKDRFVYLAEMLAERGCQVELVTSDFNHTLKRHAVSIKGDFKSKITFIHEPGYTTNVCLRRLYSHWIWGRNVAKYLAAKNQKPSCIYAAVPSLTVNNQIVSYCHEYPRLHS